jgi:hypothetical protein
MVEEWYLMVYPLGGRKEMIDWSMKTQICISQLCCSSYRVRKIDIILFPEAILTGLQI